MFIHIRDRTITGKNEWCCLLVCSQIWNFNWVQIPSPTVKDFLPVMDNVSHDGHEQTEQHDCCAGIHHWMQVIPGVWWEGQHSLQILQLDRTERITLEHYISLFSLLINNNILLLSTRMDNKKMN